MRKRFSSLAFLLLAFVCTKAEEVTNYGPLYATWSTNNNSNCTTCDMDTLLTGTPIAPLWVKDDLISSHWNGSGGLDTDLKYYSVKSVVEFGIDWTRPYFGTQDFSAELEADITYWDVDSTIHTTSCTLTIDYDRATGAQVKSKDHFVFSGGLKFKVEVQSLTYYDLGDVGGTPLTGFYPLNVYFTGYITAERYRVLDATPTYSPVATIGGGVQDRYLINWSDITGAEEYELKWTFVSEHASPHIYDLTSNFTKVTTKASAYKIPILYEEGWVIYAIRSVGRNIDYPDSVVYNNWSLTSQYGNVDTLSGAYFDVDEFDENKNWQYSISFAEEGKTKEVISYFDGTQRKRQTIARNHTDNKAIVSNTIYDSQGRPAVETLPVPTYGTNNGTLHYYNQFNRPSSDNTREYSYIDFDTTNTCDPLTGAMDNGFGSSNYYSVENPELDDENAYIPDAKLFPFVQTEYTPDNTGRIRTKSGAGADHRIGGGRETKYYYSIPFQPELDRLFANDVGNSAHYLKETVIDPNGSISVSYKNPAGKVIATALAGNPDSSCTNLIPLESSNFSDTLSVSLLDSTSADSTLGLKTAVRYYTATTAGIHHFYYDLARPKLGEICIPDSICYECVYDLTMSIKNECGEELVPDSLTFQTVGLIDTICEDSLNFTLVPDTLSMYLAVGTYAIYKELKINTSAAEYYLDEYMRRDSCLTSFDVFLDSAVNHLDFRGCGITCEECYTALGPYENYNDSAKASPDSVAYDPLYVFLTPEQYDDARDACKSLCLDSISPCDALLSTMKADITPGGQYAPFKMDVDTVMVLDANNNLQPDTTFLYSIFHLGGNSKLSNNYKYYLGSLTGDNGSDSVVVGEDTIAITDLTSSQFILAWRTEWADVMVQLHPEYCYYQFCDDHKDSYIYDRDFLNTVALNDAVDKGYLNSLNNFPHPEEAPPFVTGDPFFLDSDDDPTGWFDEMNDLMMNVPFYHSTDPDDTINIWQLAMAINVGNNDDENSCFGQGLWDAYRGLYIALKQQVLAEAMNAIADCPAFEAGGTFTEDSVQPRYILTSDEGMAELGLSDTLSDIMAQMTESPPDELAVTQYMNNMMNGQYETQCEAYATAWVASLADCRPDTVSDSLWTLVTDTLVLELVEICVNGSDENNPFGSSSAAIPSSLGHFTFEEALAEFLNLHHIPYSPDCNPSVISFPSGYGHSYGNTIALDSCICDKVLEAYHDYDSLVTNNEVPEGICSFDNYLESVLGGSVVNAHDLVVNCVLDTIIGEPIPVTCEITNEIWDDYLTSLSLSTSLDLAGFLTAYGIPYQIDPYSELQTYFDNALVSDYGYPPGHHSTFSWYQEVKSCTHVGTPSDIDVSCDLLFRLSADVSILYDPFEDPVEFLDQLTDYINFNYGHSYSVEDVEEKLRICREGATITVTTAKKPVLNAIKDFLNAMLSAESILDTTEITSSTTALSAILFPDDTCNHYYAPEAYYPRIDSTITLYTIKTAGDDTVNTGWVRPLWCYGDHKVHLLTASWGSDPLSDVTYGFINVKGGEFDGDSLFTDDVGSQVIHPVTINTFNDTDSLSFILYSKFELSTGNWDSLKMEVRIPNYQYGYDDGTFESVLAINFKDSCDSIFGIGSTPEIEIFKDSSVAWEDIVEFVGVSYIGKTGSLPPHIAAITSSSKHSYTNSAVVALPAVTTGGDTVTVYVTVPSSSIPLEDSVVVNYDPPPVQVPRDMSCAECMYCVEFGHNWADFIAENYPDFNPGLQIVPTFYPEYASSFTNYLNTHTNNNLTPQQVIDMADSCFRYGPDSLFEFVPEAIDIVNEFLEIGATDYDTTFSLTPYAADIALLGYSGPCPPSITISNGHDPEYHVNSVQLSMTDGCGWDVEFGVFVRDSIDFERIENVIDIADLLYRSENDDHSTAQVHISLVDPVDTVLGFLDINHQIGIPYLDSLSNLCFQELFVPNVPDSNECVDYLLALANSNATIMYEQYLDSIENDFLSHYNTVCMGSEENYNMKFIDKEYHFTLYYYDLAGNLMKTVPPNGVKLVKLDSMSTGLHINQHRANPMMNARVKTQHSFNSIYHLNTLNQVVQEATPDAGTKKIWYDRLGRPVVSQTAQQKADNAFSFTMYDALGRPDQTGRIEFSAPNDPMSYDTFWPDNGLSTWFYGGSDGRASEQVFTGYDIPFMAIPGFVQENLRGRVSTVIKNEFGQNGGPIRYDAATHYSYDIHGNVKSLIQEFPSGGFWDKRYFRIDYEYDLVSGNVKKVWYQRNQPDQFIHKYVYDQDNRLSQTYTSTDDVIWHNEAEYDYYQHGPLARTSLGDIQVQGQDYAYTIQGWMKAVNAGSLNSSRDIGQDGNGLDEPRGLVARDAYGFTLGYYNGDYHGIGGSDMFEPTLADDFETAILDTGLFNGNISRMVTALMGTNRSPMPVAGNAYQYDQLNRIKNKTVFLRDSMEYDARNTWASIDAADAYYESFRYDPNGNILGLLRKGDTSNVNMDSLNYVYQSGTNKLKYVRDSVGADNYPEDIDNQYVNTYSNNYRYDLDGNLVSDSTEGITEITWNNYGKIEQIEYGSGKKINFNYDAMGNRISKLVLPVGDPPFLENYVRDAQGNVMGMYKTTVDGALFVTRLTEQMIYGSTRVGILKRDTVVGTSSDFPNMYASDTLSTTEFYFYGDTIFPEDTIAYISPFDTIGYETYISKIYGNRNYELSNHLGNVLSVITDRKVAMADTNTTDTLGYYLPWVSNKYDYYAFGSLMPDRFTGELHCHSDSVEQEFVLYRNNYNSTIDVPPHIANNSTLSLVPANKMDVLSTGSQNFGVFYLFAPINDTLTITINTTFTNGSGQLVVAGGDSLTDPSPTILYINSSLPNGVYTQTVINNSGKDSLAIVIKNNGNTAPPPVRRFQVDSISITYTDWVDTLICEVDSADLAAGDNYRYGFNGKEKDNEVKGVGNSYDFGSRIYDSRLGRWMSVDPLAKTYSSLSTYNFAGNSPILLVDPDGNVILVYDADGNTYEFKPGIDAPGDDFTAQVFLSLNHLIKNAGPDAANLIRELMDDKDFKLEIDEMTDFGSGKTQYDPNQYIAYNPSEGLNVDIANPETQNSSQSPALGLLHELDHANQHRKLLNALKQARNDNNKEEIKRLKDEIEVFKAFTIKEEDRIINGGEKIAAKALGEGFRSGHGVDGVKSIYKTESPITTKPGKASESEQTQIDKENERIGKARKAKGYNN